METIIDFFTSTYLVIILSGLLLTLMYYLYRYIKIKRFRNNIQEGSLCAFYINKEKEYGRITFIDKTNIEIYHFDSDNCYYRNIDSIYPI